MSRPSFAKRDRERAKKVKADAKRERRQGAQPAAATEDQGDMGGTERAPDDRSTPELLQMLEDLHQRRAAGEIGADEFDEVKADLLARIAID